MTGGGGRRGIGVTGGEKLKERGIGFLGYREEGLGFCLSGFTVKLERERERENTYKGFSFLVFIFYFFNKWCS